MERPGGDALRLPSGYAAALAGMKADVRSTSIRVARAANSEMLRLYWRLGQRIAAQQQAEGWGTRVVQRLSADLRSEFPDVQGISPGNLDYMRRFALAWPQEVALQVVGKLGWGQVQTLPDKLDSPADRDWYAARAVEHGWSRNSLTHHIVTRTSCSS